MMDQTTSIRSVGLIGAGLMGMAFARRLREAGLGVLGFDVDNARLALLTGIGGEAAGSAGEVARRCTHLIVVVFSIDQAEGVIDDIVAAVRAAPAGRRRTVILSLTCEPARAAALGRRAEAAGLRFIVAPVSGTSDQVQRGDGVGLIGGDVPADPQLTAILDALMPRRFRVGKIADGARAKLAVNLILNLNRLALAEGLVLAERIGLDVKQFFEIARGSAAYSQVMDTKGGKMVTRDYAPHGRATQALKDLRLMLAEATAAGQSLPGCETAAALIESCIRHGEGDKDSTVIVEELRRRRTAAARGAAE